MPSAESSRRTRWIAIFSLVVVLAVAMALVRVLTGPDRAEARLARLHDELREARVAADSCKAAVEREEAEFQAYDRRVDSLRRVVRRYESVNPEGVPGDLYDAYITAFDRYNASVPVWQARADSLRAHWAACDAVVRQHNLLADSLRPLIEELRAESGSRVR